MRSAMFLACFGALPSLGATAFAGTEAYLLVRTEPGRAEEVAARNWGFGQCKGLFHSFRPHEIVVQLSCDDAASLATAVSEDLAGGEGVASVTIWMVRER
ncbi:MAG TPA: hypothetical protein VGN97_00590 [Mesorhizobium sp.]|jgi:hypothetical protein|nr:hypothetical protein [Mesorhizobium sp.]